MGGRGTLSMTESGKLNLAGGHANEPKTGRFG